MLPSKRSEGRSVHKAVDARENTRRRILTLLHSWKSAVTSVLMELYGTAMMEATVLYIRYEAVAKSILAIWEEKLTGSHNSAMEGISKIPPARIYGRRRPILVRVLSVITPSAGSITASHTLEIRMENPARAGSMRSTFVKKIKYKTDSTDWPPPPKISPAANATISRRVILSLAMVPPRLSYPVLRIRFCYCHYKACAKPCP
jgi:hypothetical protein